MKPARDIEESFADRLARPFQIFAAHKLSGAVLLLAATMVAVAWANSPWAGFYHHWLHTKLTLSVGPFVLSKSVSHWIADGLMGIFFFVVGLEIKRELLAGELANPRKAALPMSLFIATLAFEEVAVVDAVKTAVLAGSLLATLIGSVSLLMARRIQEGA